MGNLWDDFRIAARTLVKAPAFSGAVIGTLSLAIALETAVFAVVNAYLVRSLPYPEADRLYTVTYAKPGEPTPRGLVDVSWDAATDVVEHPIAWDLDVFYLVGGDHPERAPGAWVTPGFMQGLGIRPAIGRSFEPAEFESGAPQVALISHSLWQTRFRGDSAILGRRFQAYVSDRPADPEAFTIVGVLPANFWHLNTYTGILTPLRARTYPYLVSLREGALPDAAARRITQVVRDGGVSVPPGWSVELRSLHGDYARRVKPMLLAITVSVSLVLLIACANVGFLVLIRAMRRQKEVAVRLALGAGWGRVARMLSIESLLLAVASAVIGSVAALILLRQLAPTIEQQLGRTAPGGTTAVSIDPTVTASVGALAVLIAVALTLLPLAVASRHSLFAMMRRGRQTGSDTAGSRRTRSALIALEIAGSVALLVGSGLMVRTVTRMLGVDMGLEPAGIITGNLAIREQSYPDAASRVAFYTRLLESVERTPTVRSAALAYPPPLAELPPVPVHVDGADGRPPVAAGVFSVTPSFFAVLEIPLRAGRGFTALDRGDRERVALVSESAARRLWPEGNALGQKIRVRDRLTDDTAAVTRTVVGVVNDVRNDPTDEQTADVYVPLLQGPGRFAQLIVRASGPPDAWTRELRSALRQIDPEVALSVVTRLDAAAAAQLTRPRFLASLFTGFGLFATILAVMGLYGVIAFAVRQREREIAIRMALGADRHAIVSLFMREGAPVLVIGLVAGAWGAIGIGRLLEAQLYGVRPVDAATFIVAVCGIAIAAAAAMWWPSVRASGTDPALALREE